HVPNFFDWPNHSGAVLAFTQLGDTHWIINNINYPGKNNQLVGYRATLPIDRPTWQVDPLPEFRHPNMSKIIRFVKGVNRLTSKFYCLVFVERDQELFIGVIRKQPLSSESLCQVVNGELAGG